MRLRQFLISLFQQTGTGLANWAAYMALAARRLRYNLGLAASALVGMVAVFSLVVCIPAFSHSISSEVLRSELLEKTRISGRSLFSLHIYYLDKSKSTPFSLPKAHTLASFILENAPRHLGLPVRSITLEAQTERFAWQAQTENDSQSDEPYFEGGFLWIDGLTQHARITEGAWPEPAINAGGPIQVAVLEEVANKRLINVGDRFTSGPFEVVVAGLWVPVNPRDPFFYDSPGTVYSNLLWVPEETFTQRLEPVLARPLQFTSWYVIFDDDRLQFQQAPRYTRGLNRLDSDLRYLIPGLKTDYTPLDQLNAYLQRAESLATLFYVISAPAGILLLLFIGLVASIAVSQKDREIATMRGRGSTRFQVVGLAFAEVLLLLLVALPFAILLGWLEAGLIARTLSFLRFSPGARVPINLQGLNSYWLIGVSVVVVAAWLLPAQKMAQASIIRVKQERARGLTKPLWERYYLDFLLLLPGIYTYLTLKGVVAPVNPLVDAQTAGAAHYRDPLMFAAPALFAIALCMLSLRVLPLLTALFAGVADRLPFVWAYLSLKQIARRPQDHIGSLLLIMISLSLAIYSASMAKTLDRWMYDSFYYQSGADLVIHEYVLEGNDSNPVGPSSGRGEITVSDLDLNLGNFTTVEDHLTLPYVESVTRVGRYEGTFSYGSGELKCLLMGIDRMNFSQVAFFRKDFTEQPVDLLMNDLGLEPMGVLVPRSLAQQNGFRVGDRLLISAQILEEHVENDMLIVGMYDYFPTIYPGKTPTLIVNLDSLFANPDSALGYDLWFKLQDRADIPRLLEATRTLIGGGDVHVQVRAGALGAVRESLALPERVGLFGVLNVGFLVTGLMPGIGFVLYSYASLRRRFIQLGILRAVGLSIEQMVGYLALEQLFLMSLAIALGAFIGLLTSTLFLPFLQVGAAPGTPVPPFQVLIGWLEAGGLSLVFFLVLSVTIAGMITYLAHIKVFQAIKMGEEE